MLNEVWVSTAGTPYTLNLNAFLYALAALLFAHIIADFAIRREFPRRGNVEPGEPYYRHLLVFALVSILLLICIPIRLLVSLLVIPVLALLHFLIDRWAQRSGFWFAEVLPAHLRFFAWEQILKLAVLTIGALVIAQGVSRHLYLPSGLSNIVFASVPFLLGYSIALFVGDALVSMLLSRIEPDEDETDQILYTRRASAYSKLYSSPHS